MICDNCKNDRLITDFINNQEFCYHCIYRIKLQKSMENRTPSSSSCRTCGGEVIRLKNEKKRQRNVFCSCECAKKGHKELIKNYWIRKMGRPNFWKAKGENKWNTNQK